MSSLLFDEDVVRKKEGARMKLGLVLENYDNTSDEENESDEDSDDDEPKGKKGHVLVAWYPKGRSEVVPHDKVQLHDRSLMAGDLVQRSSSNSSSGQLGTVKAVHVTCNLQANSSKQIIYGVHSKKIQPITRIYPGTYASLDGWVGEVEDITTEVVVVLKNGARCALSENAAGKLTDIHDYSVEDCVFGDTDGFYPGQTLWGRSSAFKNARWLSGQQPVMTSRSHLRVVVEGVNLTKLNVNWQTSGLKDVTTIENEESTAPPLIITGDDLQRLKPIHYFSADRIQVGDKGTYQICGGDVVSAKAVPKGSPVSYKESTKVQSKKLLTIAPPSPDEGKQKNPDQEGTPKETAKDGEPSKFQGGGVPAELEKPESELGRAESGPGTDAQEPGVNSGEKTVPVEEGAPSGTVAGGTASGIHGQLVESSGTDVPVPIEEEGSHDDDDVGLRSNASGVGESTQVGDEAGGIAGRTKTDDRGGEEEELADVLTTSESQQLEALCDLSAQFCGEFKSLVEMARRFRSSIPGSPEAASEVERRMEHFEEVHTRMRGQILRAQRLLSAKANHPPGGGEGVSEAGKAVSVDKKRAVGSGMTADSADDESSSDGSGDEDGNDSEVSSQSSFEGDRGPRRNGHGSRRRKRHNSTKKRDPVTLGDVIGVEITHTHTMVDVEWQDGTMSPNLEASTLTPVDLLEDMHFFPGDFVTRSNEAEENNVYGVVRSLDYNERTCQVCWINKPNQQSKIPRVARTEEVSIYDLVPHADFRVHIGEVVIRIGYTSLPEGESTEDKPVAGQVLSITPEGMVNVTWVDRSQSAVYPQDLYLLDADGSSNSSSEEDGSDHSGGEGESDSSESGSWETATDKSDTEEDHRDDDQGEGEDRPAGVGATAGGDNRSDVSHENGHKLEVGAEGGDDRHESSDKANARERGGPMVNGRGDDDVGNEPAAGSPVIENGNKGDRLVDNGGKRAGITENGDVEITGVGTDVTGVDGRKRAENEGVSIVQCDKCGQRTAAVSAIMKDATTSTDGNLSEDASGEVTVAAATGAIPKATVDRSIPVMEGKEAEAVRSKLQKDVAKEEASLGGVFTLVETTPECHHFYSTSVQPTDQRKFLTALRKEVQLLKSSLPPGIWLKGFEDKMHLFSALIEGPADTPYEDCLFYFDGHLPESYPRKPPVVHYHAFCPGKLNPNLYNEGKICLSLLDTWTGKGSEVWTKKSSLLQLLVSIQGLILNSEPYFNEAGYEKHRGSAHGTESSRMYNETALIKVIQSVTNLVGNPPEVFREETLSFYMDHATRLISRVEGWLTLSEGDRSVASFPDVGFPLFPLSRGFIISARQVVKNLRSRWEEVCASTDAS